MKSCKITACTCKHEYQDQIYGRGQRVFNPRLKPGEYRCTVCGANKTVEAEKASKK